MNTGQITGYTNQKNALSSLSERPRCGRARPPSRAAALRCCASARSRRPATDRPIVKTFRIDIKIMLRAILTRSRSDVASCCTKSLSEARTISGSTSAADTCPSRRDGERDRMGLMDRLGDPVRGMGLPRPSVVVAYVFSKPLVGEVGRDRRGLGLRVRMGLMLRGMRSRRPIVRRRLLTMLDSCKRRHQPLLASIN